MLPHRTNWEAHILDHAEQEVHDDDYAKMVDDFMSVNIETVDVGKLTDISTLEFDNSLPKEKRLTYVWRS